MAVISVQLPRVMRLQTRNVPAIELLEAVGMTKAREFVKGLGINVPADTGLSYGIGGNVSTVDEAAAYGAFANGGTYYAPTYIHKVENSRWDYA